LGNWRWYQWWSSGCHKLAGGSRCRGRSSSRGGAIEVAAGHGEGRWCYRGGWWRGWAVVVVLLAMVERRGEEK